MIQSSQEIDGWFDFPDLYSSYAKILKHDSIFVELGVWKGRSICFLGEELVKLDKKPKVFAIDTFKGTDNDERQQKEIERLGGNTLDVFKTYLEDLSLTSLITILAQDSAEAAKNFEDNSIDIIFIDADHSYEAVKKDLEIWYPKMKKDSIMSGHDYWFEPLRKAVGEFFYPKDLLVSEASNSSWLVNIKK